METAKRHKFRELFYFFTLLPLLILSLPGAHSFISSPEQVFAQNTISLEPYCQQGWYVIPGEKKCSRAPKCGGSPYDDYDWVSANIHEADHTDCLDVSMVEGNPPNTNAMHGYFPLCCYEVERTGDFLKCIGYWERLWCGNSQCENAKTRGASDSQCGGSCQCGHATRGWGYGDVEPVSLEIRLHQNAPTNTPTTVPPSSTNTPTTTRTPTPNPSSSPTLTPTRTPSPTIAVSLTPTRTPTPMPTAFPTTGPAMLPKLTPQPYPATPHCPSTASCALKFSGDGNCDGRIDLADFLIWFQQIDRMPQTTYNANNSNYVCTEGNSQTYFSDLTDYEKWRKNSSILQNGNTPIQTTGSPTPTTPSGSSPTSTPIPGQPTSTPTTVPSATPTPTQTNTAGCPTSSSNQYGTTSVNTSAPRSLNPPAAQHPDINLSIRGFAIVNEPLNLIDYDGHTDTNAPKLNTMLGKLPSFSHAYQVYDWDWDNNRKGNLVTLFPVGLLGFATQNGETVRMASSGYNIDGSYQAMVLYADDNRITIKYTREDNVIYGYTIHVEDICVDPNLRSLYNNLNSSGRNSLPALEANKVIGTAKGAEIKVAIRDTGNFMDPRSRKDWWPGL